MNPGDLVRYWFIGKFPVTGLVLKKWKAARPSFTHASYLYTVDILEADGKVNSYDIRAGDNWELINAGDPASTHEVISESG